MEKYSTGICKLCILMLLLCMPFSLWAQKTVTVSGTVTDSNNEPVIGAAVVVKNTNIGLTTGVDGEYTIQAPENGTLAVSFVGLTPVEEKIDGRTRIDIVLSEDRTLIDDIVVVGYGTQKRGSISGAVSAVKGSEMIQTKNENPQNMLTGRVPGLRVWQKSSEPGTYNAAFDIRGMGSPMVVIDGVPRTVEDFQRLNAGDIEDVSILKDASAAIYGVRAGNGVVLVTTKKGKEGRAKVSYTGSFTFQVPSKMPKLANPFETMTLYNEKAMNNVEGGNPVYTEENFEDFRNGTRRTTDWNSLMFSDFSPQTQHDISISGGSEKTQYYVSMGYFYQEGFFRSGDLNYDKFNLRSNLSTQIVKGLTFDLNISGFADERNTPYTRSVDIIRNYWRQGVLAPAYADPENTMLNYEGLDLGENAVAEMTADVSGHRKFRQKNFQSAATLNFDFGTLTPALQGLSVKGMASFDYRLDDNEIFRKEYYQYAYNKTTGEYDRQLYTQSSPNQLRREHYSKQQLLGQIVLNYDRTFHGVHKVGVVAGWEVQKRKGDNFYALRNLAFGSPYLTAGVNDGQVGSMSKNNNDFYELANAAVIGRLNYAYDNRYILEAQFRYDGSSRLAKGNQWGFFPSISGAWRVSEEPFFKSSSALSFINQLKIRASYGELGDDGSTDYAWATGFDYPSTGDNAENGYYAQYAPGYMIGGKFVLGATPLAIPNPSITWYTSRTLDIGIDFEAWNGLFGFSFDYFDRRRSGLFIRRGDLPTVIGATAPLENINSDRQFGMELELTHRNTVGDFSYNIRGIATITRRKHMKAAEKGPYGNSYDRWRNDNLTNRYQGVQFGYESAGRYQNWLDIWNYPIYKDRDILPGDYKYLDWNGDGEISGLDEHPFAFDQTPWMNFSLSFEGSYRNFDLSLLFQGSALGSMEYKEPLYSIWGSNGGGALEQYLDRWHPVDPTADPYNPSTEWVSGYYGYTGHYPKGNSDFNRVSTSYLRLKSLEIGYTLPKFKGVSNMSLRVYANAYNLFTITGVKFVDPEHPDDELGRMYPLNKTYTLGLSLSF